MPCFLLSNNIVPSIWPQSFSITPSKLAFQILVVIHTSKETEDEMPSLKIWIESVCLLANMTFFSKLIFNLFLEGQIVYYLFKIILSYLRCMSSFLRTSGGLLYGNSHIIHYTLMFQSEQILKDYFNYEKQVILLLIFSFIIVIRYIISKYVAYNK